MDQKTMPHLSTTEIVGQPIASRGAWGEQKCQERFPMEAQGSGWETALYTEGKST
jgi:hypothetical protein